jgi:hypothetical protein
MLFDIKGTILYEFVPSEQLTMHFPFRFWDINGNAFIEKGRLFAMIVHFTSLQCGFMHSS